jgi:hypothetical protein
MPPRRMQQEIVSELAFGLKSDNAFLTESIICGEKVELSEAMSLGAMAEPLYITATLESRALGKIADCHQLWSEAAGLFSELCDSWNGIESGEQSIAWLCGRLAHYRSLCEDRRGLYSITEEERSEYAERRSGLPDEEPEPQQEPVREFSKLETASIERAYRRL